MKEYIFTKTLGVIVGTLSIFTAIGFGLLSLIGMGLSKALNSSYNNSSDDEYVLLIFIILLLFGFITVIVPYQLKKEAWRIFYTGFCFVLGVGFVVTFFISLGSIGNKNEIFILCIGLIYLLLGYLAKRKK
jgi:hypothetical protein